MKKNYYENKSLKKIKECWDSKHPDLKTGRWGEICIHPSIPLLDDEEDKQGAHFEFTPNGGKRNDLTNYGVEIHNCGLKNLDQYIKMLDNKQIDNHPINISYDSRKTKCWRARIAIPKKSGEEYCVSIMEKFRDMFIQKLKSNNYFNK